MIAVIFEVWPKPEHKQDYLDLAAGLRPILETIDGFISIERFESISNKGKFVSLSYWRDEECVRKWRNLQKHREAQRQGRGGIFKSYRLRVANEVRSMAEISLPAAVVEDTHPHPFELSPEVRRILVVRPTTFTCLTDLNDRYADLYSAFLLGDMPGSLTWPYSDEETAAIAAWPRWTALGPVYTAAELRERFGGEAQGGVLLRTEALTQIRHAGDDDEHEVVYPAFQFDESGRPHPTSRPPTAHRSPAHAARPAAAKSGPGSGGGRCAAPAARTPISAPAGPPVAR